MRRIKRLVCGLSAAVMAVTAASCAKGGSDSGESSQQDTASENGAVTTAREIITSREREVVETEPVVETMGNFDIGGASSETAVPEDFKVELEGEKGTLNGASVLDKSFVGEFSGDGFAVVTEDTSVEFEVEFPAEGSYDLNVVSAADQEGTKASITIDGNAFTSFDINSLKFDNNSALKVLIGEGKHTIGFKTQSVPIYIDKITITAAQKIDMADYEVNRTLCNPNASEETRRLYNFLCDSYGNYIISGQYAADNNGLDSREFIDINQKLGDYPAIMGLDMIELSPSRVLNNSAGGYKAIQNAKDWYLNHNGIVTMCWHWNAPEPYIGGDLGAWWEGFYKEHTNISLTKILNGDDPEGYDLLIRDIDSIACYLQELDDYHVPILWRPLHEGGGDPKWNNPWFWWGSSGADSYKELWKLMYDRITNYHGVNNLIWVWNGQNAAYYPGDEYVDIIGYDVYGEKEDYSSKKWYYDYTKSCAGENKICAMTENGILFDPDAAMADGTRWAWFATWNGEFTIKDMELPGEYTSMEMWEKIYSSDKVLTLSELPDLKSYPLDTEKYLAENK